MTPRNSLANIHFHTQRESGLGMTNMPLLCKPNEGRTIAVVGDVYRFLATGDDTNGTVPCIIGFGVRKVYHNNDRKSGYSISVTISAALFVCQRISS